MDHRWGNRIALDLPIRVMHPAMSRCGSGRLSNISLGGALIVSSLDCSVGARIQVSLTLPSGGSAQSSVLDAYLVRRSGPAIAVEWTEFAPTEVIDLVRMELRPAEGPSPGEPPGAFALV
jgi:PilZ domain